MSGYDFEVWICPVCREQTDDAPGDEAGHLHDAYGWVDAVKVPVLVIAEAEQLAIAEIQDKLKAQRRRHETREAHLDWFRSLPQEERDRMEDERRAKMSPFELMLESAVLDQVAATRAVLNSPGFWTVPTCGTAAP